jgi:hypothetical protein
MRKPTKREWALIALVLPVIVIAAMGGDPDGEDGTAAVAEVARPDKNHSASRRDADAGELDLSQLRREPRIAELGNAFETKSWYVPPPPPPPPPPAPPPPPPKPTAPPLPFTYLGKYQDGAAPIIFLVRGDRILTVKEGDTIEGTYRVDSIVGASLGLTYLPLNIKQKINIGSAG